MSDPIDPTPARSDANRPEPARPRVFLWAAFGDRSTPPGRLEVIVCEQCAALVAVEHTAPHDAWHTRRYV